MRREGIQQDQKYSHRTEWNFVGIGECVHKIIICAIAVLSESDSISAVTFWMVVCVTLSCALLGSTSSMALDNSHSPAWFSRMSKRHTRARKRETPSTPRMLHGFICSSGPINIS